ncbi:MAG: glycosyltransferase [Euryarchaeota archaeon]|nr:glycosyltransferase [Euryarchaeota archaeon]
MYGYSDLTVIIPTLNEEQNIETLLNELITLYPGCLVFVSDDGSTDRTGDIVRAFVDNGVMLIDRSDEQVHGLTASVLDGIMRTSTDYFVVIDGDLQHPPEKIGELVAVLRRGHVLVVGVRADVPGWGWHRRVISGGASQLGRVALRLRGAPQCSDIMSGFFGAKTSFVRPYVLRYASRFELGGFKVLFDLLKLLPGHTIVCEVSYVFGARGFGSSKMDASHIFSYIRSLMS